MHHQDAVDGLVAERYLLEEMTEAERLEFEEHYFSCPMCAEDVRMGVLMTEGLKDASPVSPFVKPSRPAAGPAVRRRWGSWNTAALAAAASLALVAGYQAVIVVPGLRRDLAPQALTPVVLRSQTRGAAVVHVDPASGFVALSIDLDPAPARDEVLYTLRHELSGERLSGRAAMPVPGNPLLLLVPAKMLAEPGRYVLSMRGSSGVDLGERDFTISK